MKNAPPLVPLSLGVAAGVALAEGGIVLWCAVAAALLVLASRDRRWCLLGLAGVVAGCLAYQAAIPPKSGSIAMLWPEQPAELEIAGRIAAEPIARSLPAGSRLDFPLEVSRFRADAGWIAAPGRIWVRCKVPPGGSQDLHWDDRIAFVGLASRPPLPSNPYVFDFRDYLRRQGIHRQADVRGDLRVLAPAIWSRLLFSGRDRFREGLLRGLTKSADVAGLVSGMVLGLRAELPDEVTAAFRLTGTLHVVAISGLHITLIAAMIAAVLRAFGLPRPAIALILIPLLLGYILMTGCQASAVRSLIMAGVFLLGWVVHRPAHLLNSLALAALIILVVWPGELWDAGFQLSFLVVAAIVALEPGFRARLRPWYEPDPLLPSEFVTGAQRTRARWAGHVAGLFSVSLAAWIGSLGLIAYHFHVVSSTAILCNLIVVPLSSLSLGLGFGAIGLDFLGPQWSAALNHAQWAVVKLMLATTRVFENIPGAYSYLSQPAPWAVACLYAAALLAFFGKGRVRRAGLVACVLAGGAAVFTGLPARLEATALEVKSGQAILLEKRWDGRVLVDGGNAFEGKLIVEPFLRAKGVNRLDAVVATHGDAAHVGGLVELIRRVPTRQLIVSAAPTRSRTFRKLIQAAEERGIPVRAMSAGEMAEVAGLKLEALWPAAPFGKRADDNCLVLRCEDLLLLSDLPGSLEHHLSIQRPAVAVRGAGDEFFEPALMELTRGVIFCASDRLRGDLVGSG
ncbi:MAG: ComEC/Rec2 family competence protein, partial [Verrucomicrobiae bacterium]|nr:ComEC/Rec2 family competence protein [Verrucomicrobiae bacterium]